MGLRPTEITRTSYHQENFTVSFVKYVLSLDVVLLLKGCFCEIVSTPVALPKLVKHLKKPFYKSFTNRGGKRLTP